MLRSLMAVILAVILGLAVARWIEAAGLAVSGAPHGFLHQLSLIFGWGAGAYGAGLAAVLIGLRWRPLGFLAAAAIGLNGFLTLMGAPLSLWTWLLTILCVIGGGWLSVISVSTSMIAPELRGDDMGGSGDGSSQGGGLFK